MVNMNNNRKRGSLINYSIKKIRRYLNNYLNIRNWMILVIVIKKGKKESINCNNNNLNKWVWVTAEISIGVLTMILITYNHRLKTHK